MSDIVDDDNFLVIRYCEFLGATASVRGWVVFRVTRQES